MYGCPVCRKDHILDLDRLQVSSFSRTPTLYSSQASPDRCDLAKCKLPFFCSLALPPTLTHAWMQASRIALILVSQLKPELQSAALHA